jgi:hypothetical protein
MRIPRREQTHQKFEEQLKSEQWKIPPGGFMWSEADQNLLTMIWEPMT